MIFSEKMRFCKILKGHILRTVLGILLSILLFAGSALAIPYAYVSNSGDNSVSVIDTATNVVIYTIYYVGSGPTGVAVNPAGTRAYVTSSGNWAVSVIDIVTNRIIATVPVGNDPQGIVINPTGTKVYVANYWSNSVSVIDAATNNVTVTIPVGNRPQGIAVTPDGTKVYVTNYGSSSVSVINTVTNTVSDTMPVGSNPIGIVVNPAGTKVYVANHWGGSISIIDIATHTITAVGNVGNGPWGIAINPAGTRAYVTNYYGNGISVIDTVTNTVITRTPVGSNPNGIAINPAGTKVFVANRNSNNVSVIDTLTNNVTATITVGRGPIAFGKFIVPTPTSASITVTSPNGGEIWQAGTTHAIKWTYTGHPGANVKIELFKGGKLNGTIIPSTSIGSSGSGSYNWGIPLTKTPGTDYKVKITSTTNSVYYDSSNANFTINVSTICNVSKIYGYSFNDSNGNKIKDPGEAGLYNWAINLNGYDTCKGILVSKTIKTNLTGYYSFTSIDPGVYVVSQNFVVTWLPTTDAAYTLAIPSISKSIRKDFGNKKFIR